MSNFNYDKSVLKGLGVGEFLGEVKIREQHINAAPAEDIQSIFNANILAEKLHPSCQFVKVVQVIDRVDAKSFVLAADQSKGTEKLAYFRAGQYICIALCIGAVTCNRPYSLSSGPKDALTGSTYMITVKRSKGGFAGEFILDNWTVGTEAVISGPLGDFYYQELRDAKNVVAIAGGSGITPFYSMACAIADGIEDFNLTILYGSRTVAGILLREELDAVAARSKGKVKVVYVISDEQSWGGYEYGFITSDLIKKYAPNDEYSLFVCGPKAMYPFMRSEIEALGIRRKYVRFELSGEYGDPAQDPTYPKGFDGKEYKITVHIRGTVKVVPVKTNQTLLSAMEAGGIRVPSDCRSGKCGWCHSRLISGKVFIPKGYDARRAADKKFGWIHPCITYPLGNIEIEVFPL